MNVNQKPRIGEDQGADSGVYAKKTAKKITTITALVVAAVLVLNAIITVLGDARLWYLDLTLTRYKSQTSTMYSLSEECADMVGAEAIPMIEQVNNERKARGEEK